MSSVQSISSSISFSAAASQAPVAGAGAASSAGGADAAASIASPNSAMGQHISSLVSMSSDSKGLDALASLVIALLMQKASESKEKDKTDPWAMLAGMALMGMMQQQGQVSLFQELSVSGANGASFQSTTVASAAGGSLNMQG